MVLAELIRLAAKEGGMETVVGAITIAFVLWWLAEEFEQIARRNKHWNSSGGGAGVAQTRSPYGN
jgi:hypothetical protein